MQDFQLSGRIFGDAVTDRTGNADNRWLRSFPSATMLGPHQPPPPVKCPRCDSVNTKFCYYNNYNLSQPRHFCKSCRRYWTKGGVLRNVPVGGGCRKPKRPVSKSSPKSSSDDKDRPRPSFSRSSSDSSLPDSVILFNSSFSNPNFRNPGFDRESEIFPDAGGSFSSLLAPTISQAPPHLKLEENRVPQMVLPQGREGSSTIVWPPAMDPAIYDLAGATDLALCWSQGHWGDGDPSLYPP